MLRTHEAGTLRADHAGQTVTLAGWVARRRDHGGVAFLDLRDASGVVQVVVRDAEVAHDLRDEYCIRVTGDVSVRPAGNENPDLPTGDVEVVATELEVLSESAPLPFQIDDHVEVGEEARLRYRYLDLRRPGPAAAIRLRSEVNRAARDVLLDRRFVEVETPTLTRSTPEGARDFLVPARLQPGQLVRAAAEPAAVQAAADGRRPGAVLPDRPLLSRRGLPRRPAAGVHPARHRDELRRAGRRHRRSPRPSSPRSGRSIGHEIPPPLPRMTYAEAMSAYGTDKPDLRFGLELTECTDYFADTEFRVFQAPYVGAVVMPGGAAQPRKQLDAWQEWAKQRGARGLAYVLVGDDGELGGPVAKNLTDDRAGRPGRARRRRPGRLRLLRRRRGEALAGAARRRPAARSAGAGGLIDESAWSFLWVVDAPLFEPASDATASGDVAVGSGAGPRCTTRSPRPRPSPSDTFDTDPGAALAYAYDIVCNGNEIGGGSIRIHRRDVQERVFAVMGLTEDEAQEKFGFLLDAFAFGAPPHGGIAFGWDRICALLSGTRLDPRRHRLPEDRRRLRPAHRRPGARSRPSSARKPASTPTPDRDFDLLGVPYSPLYAPPNNRIL